MRYRDAVLRCAAQRARSLRSPLERAPGRPVAVPMALQAGERLLFHVVAELQPTNLIKLEPEQARL